MPVLASRVVQEGPKCGRGAIRLWTLYLKESVVEVSASVRFGIAAPFGVWCRNVLCAVQALFVLSHNIKNNRRLTLFNRGTWNRFAAAVQLGLSPQGPCARRLQLRSRHYIFFSTILKRIGFWLFCIRLAAAVRLRSPGPLCKKVLSAVQALLVP